MNYDAIVYQNILLEGQKERIAEETLEHLKRLYSDLALVAEKYNGKNLNEIYVLIRDLINKHYEYMDNDLKKQLKEIGFVHQGFENDIYKEVSKETNIPVTALALSSVAMTDLITKMDVVAVSYTKGISNNKKKVFDDVKNTVRFGLMNGWDLADINKSVKTKVNINARDMNNFIQTSVRSTLAEIEDEISKNNKSLSDEEIYLAVLDSVTTKICRDNHGKTFKVGEGQQTPAHHNCRSIRVKKIKNVKYEIDKNYNDFIKRTEQEGLTPTKSGNLERGSIPKYSLETYEKKINKNLNL